MTLNHTRDCLATGKGYCPVCRPSDSFCGPADYTVLYCWIGGREEGAWYRVATYSVKDTIARLTRQGYVTVHGADSVGPSEGPPSDDRFKALGL